MKLSVLSLANDPKLYTKCMCGTIRVEAHKIKLFVNWIQSTHVLGLV